MAVWLEPNVFPYWVLLTIFSAGALEHRPRDRAGAQSAPLLIAGGLLMALMVGLRYEVGADWEPYLDIYQSISYLDLGDTLALGDPGFSLLNWLGHRLGFSIWFVNLVCAGVFTWGLISFSRRQPNPWLAVTVAIPYLVLVVAMGYTRQAVAIGLILAALASFDQRRLARFIILIAIAATFHKTAVIVLPLVAAAETRNRFVTGGLLLLIGVILYWTFLQSSVDMLLTNYVEAEYNSQGALIRVVMNLAPALLFLFIGKRLAASEAQWKLWRNFSYAAILMFALLFLVASSTAIDRIALYIIPLQMFVLSRLPYAFPVAGRPNGQVRLAVIGYCVLVQFVWLTYGQHAQHWLPYRFYPLAT